jgi:hypothetical protein
MTKAMKIADKSRTSVAMPHTGDGGSIVKATVLLDEAIWYSSPT